MNRPKLVMAHLVLLSQLERYSDAELRLFAKRLHHAGYDAIRVFGQGGDDGSGDLLFPWNILDWKADLFMFNETFWFHVRRLAKILGDRGVALYIDIYDQCAATGGGWFCNWWGYSKGVPCNINGVNGWEDTSTVGLETFKELVKKYIDEIAAATAVKPIIGMGNELCRRNDADVDLSWVQAWAWPRIAYLKSVRQEIPIPISGGGRTIHKLIGWCGPEDGYFPEPLFTEVFHGIGMVAHVPPDWGNYATLQEALVGASVENRYSWSEDGVDSQDWNQVPPDKRGVGNADNSRFPANIEETIKVIQAFKDSPMQQLDIVEILPYELSDKQHLNELENETLQKGRIVINAVYGEDPAREPWTIKFEVCDKTGHLPNNTCTKITAEASEDEPTRPTCTVNHTPPIPPQSKCSKLKHFLFGPHSWWGRLIYAR